MAGLRDVFGLVARCCQPLPESAHVSASRCCLISRYALKTRCRRSLKRIASFLSSGAASSSFGNLVAIDDIAAMCGFSSLSAITCTVVWTTMIVAYFP